ncbi:hypothetical protein JCM15765_32180 [Paradesulfitobacterium aromaticivorans]
MVSLEALTDYLQNGNPYPCLSVLEAALASARYTPEKLIPEPLLQDLAQCYGEDIIRKEIDWLSKEGILTGQSEKDKVTGLRFVNVETGNSIATLIDQLISSMELQLLDKRMTAETFLVQLVSYLKREISELVLDTSDEPTKYTLYWQKEKYELQLALSPIWLPVTVGDDREARSHRVLFGPFAAQGWEKMHKYYAYPQFRSYTACYDPWNCQKMNISKGRLFPFVDWFFRDVYGLKFLIPQPFAEALHNIGLLRYNDEK